MTSSSPRLAAADRLPSHIEVPLSRGLVALVDAADEALVQGKRWYAFTGGHTFYAARDLWSKNRKSTLLMHRVLTGFDLTDHINGNGLDNRRANLRSATVTQNHGNKRKTWGRSRYKGIHWNARVCSWHAQIQVHGKKRSLGYYKVEEEAALAYDAGAREAFGDFAAVNFPRPGERGALADWAPQ